MRIAAFMTGKETSLRLVLNIPAAEYQRVYRGTARTVYARSTDGKIVRFPVSILQPFLTHEGINGEFEIRMDENNRFQSIVRV